MPLPKDLTKLLMPNELLIENIDNLARGYRFYILGYANARRRLLGINRPRDVLIERKGNNYEEMQKELIEAIPEVWKTDLPDPLERKIKKKWKTINNTYWGYLAQNQLEKASKGEAMSLYKALQCVVAMWLRIKKDKGIDWDPVNDEVAPVVIAPAIYWIEGYNKNVFSESVKVRQPNIYKECNLKYYVTPKLQSRALENAAAGYTLTNIVASKLRDLLPVELQIGHIQTTENKHPGEKISNEVFLSTDHPKLWR